jgi:beta-glucosidase
MKTLVGFRRIFIPQGQSVSVEIPVPVKMLRHYDAKTDKYEVAKGEFVFEAGASSADIRCSRAMILQ